MATLIRTRDHVSPGPARAMPFFDDDEPNTDREPRVEPEADDPEFDWFDHFCGQRDEPIGADAAPAQRARGPPQGFAAAQATARPDGHAAEDRRDPRAGAQQPRAPRAAAGTHRHQAGARESQEARGRARARCETPLEDSEMEDDEDRDCDREDMDKEVSTLHSWSQSPPFSK